LSGLEKRRAQGTGVNRGFTQREPSTYTSRAEDEVDNNFGSGSGEGSTVEEAGRCHRETGKKKDVAGTK